MGERKLWTKSGSVVAILLITAGILLFVSLMYYGFISFKGRTNLLLIGQSLTLLSVDHSQKTITAVGIPDNLQIEASFGRGEVTIGALYKLDQLSRKSGDLLTSSVREYFGLPVDGWIILDKNSTIYSRGDLELVLKKDLNPFNFMKLKDELIGERSSINFIKLRRLLFEVSSTSMKSLDFVELTNSLALSDRELPDNSIVLVADQYTLDAFLSKIFIEVEILKESLSISVLNATETAGLAQRVARMLKNIGSNVVVVSNTDIREPECIVKVKPEYKDYYTTYRIAKTYKCIVRADASIVNERSDLTVVMGSTYAREIKGK